MNVLLQYKTYGIGFGQRVIARATQGHDTRQESVAAMSQLLGSTAAFGMMTVTASSMVAGKGLPSFDPKTPEGMRNLAEAILPVGGYVGDMLANSTKPYTKFGDLFMGPMFGEGSDTYNFMKTMGSHASNSLFDQNRRFRHSAADTAMEFAKSNVPYMNNVFLTAINKNWIKPPDNQR